MPPLGPGSQCSPYPIATGPPQLFQWMLAIMSVGSPPSVSNGGAAVPQPQNGGWTRQTKPGSPCGDPRTTRGDRRGVNGAARPVPVARQATEMATKLIRDR